MSQSRWSAYRPSASAPWDLARVWTLRRRAGFAATWDELQRDLESGHDAAVDRVGPLPITEFSHGLARQHGLRRSGMGLFGSSCSTRNRRPRLT